MNKRTRRVKLFTSLLLALAMILSAVPFVIFVSAAETDDETNYEKDLEIAEVGASAYSHRSVSFDVLPFTPDEKTNNSIDKLFIDSTQVYLDINGEHRMTVTDAYSRPANSRVSFSSADSSIASVSASGLIKAKKSGKTVVSAKDQRTGKTLACTVYVGTAYAPAIEPTQSATQFPTNPPKPTQTPTQKSTTAPTQAPTQKQTTAPTQAPTQKPTTAPAQPTQETLSLKATSATVYRGCYYHVVAVSNTTVSFTSSNNSVATVNSNGIVTALSTGSVTITAKTKTKSATCKLNIISGQSVNISHTNASVTRFMTFLMNSSTSGVKWSSSDTSVATVSDGFVYGAKAGVAVITASTSKGAATCVMTVNPSHSVRFAYTSPNCAVKNQKVTLIAITDTMRTAVRFQVGSGSTAYFVNATSCVKDADTYVWKGTTSFTNAGTYAVKAYSQFNNQPGWYSCSDGDTTAFVAASTDKTTTACTARRASDEVINLIATFEGFSKSAYADIFTGDPTLGYGRVVYSGEEFYNDLTKTEAYAYLVQTVNNEGYADRVNSFLIDNNVKYNQQQFDALVCFVYNTGTGPLYYDDDLISAILDCSDGSGSKKTYYISGDDVRIRTGAGTSYGIIRELSYGTSLTIISTSNKDWYYVQLSDGTKGYVSSDYISSRSTGGNLDLKYINKQNFINKFCQYHHAGGCVYGLLYRRVDETEIFFYGDYEPCYGDYKYPINFVCANNPSFHT